MRFYQCAKFHFLIQYGFWDTRVETEEEEQQQQTKCENELL